MPNNNKSFKRKKKITILLTISLVVIIISTLSVRALKRKALQKQEASKNTTQIVPVKVKKLKTSNLSIYIKSSAIVQAWQESIISSEVSGKVKSVNAKVGDKLSKGDIILKIDDEILRYRLEDSMGRKLQLEANYENSKNDLNRKENLYKDKVISFYDLEQSRAKEKADKGLLMSARAAFKIAERDLRETSITSPIDGTLAERFVDLGTNVSKNQKLASVVFVRKVKVIIGVTDIEKSKITTGQKVKVVTGSFSDTEFQGNVYSIGLKADEGSLTYPVEIVVENDNASKLNPGMFVNVSISVSSLSNCISVPQSILNITSSGNFVWLIENNKAVKKNVKPGNYFDSDVIINNGLNPDDLIVVLGHENLVNGCYVKIIK